MAAAVEVRNGYKYYGSKSNPKVILNNLSMHVSAGSIYGLLGASGCGKTTLLSCIVGQRKLNGGEVSVLGIPPGDLPGSRIGYMPQEIALVEEMTVKETIFYFGRIYGLTDEKIREKFKLLRDLLQLPPARQLVKNCSGGQQRRVSFACALIHEPELLILDEPTVGLDPMLREKIWDFLVESTRNTRRAVIITTHYIEEAKQAHCIGLMRNGILLAEDKPSNILERFECNSIEDAFLKLCMKQGDTDVVQGRDDSAAIANHNSHQHHPHHATTQQHLPVVIHSDAFSVDTSVPSSEKFAVDENDNQANVTDVSYDSENRKKIWFTTKGRLKALMTKNFVQLFRQPSGIIFMLLFPIIQLSCFYLAIGKTPNNLKIGIVSDEVSNYDACFSTDLRTVWIDKDEDCHFDKVSCRYISELGDSIAERRYFNSTEEALRAAKKTEIVGYVFFPYNFTSSLKARVDLGKDVDDYHLENSQFDVHLDMTDQQVAFLIERKLRDVFATFHQNIFADCNINVKAGSLPIRFNEPIYGNSDIEFQQYVAPGVVMTMVFFLATLMTAAVFISERMDGVWDRTLVAGVSVTEMLWAHLLTQIIIMAFQSFEVIMYIGLVFDTYNKGDTCTLIGLLTLTAFCGMLFGLLISVYCKSHTEANFVATGAFYPMIILCGLLWPLEGMPKVLQDIVMFFPFTIPTMAARNIIEKGWSITNGQVYNGFIVMTAWIVIFFTLCMIGIRRKA